MGRIAVLADVHGVLPALEAVLAEASADVVVVAGDVVSGPQPREVLRVLRGMDVVWVRGNADREAVAMARGEFEGEAPDAVSPWAAGQLSAEEVEFLSSLPTSVTIGDVLVCHATPRDDEEVVLVDSSVRRWREVLSTVPEHIDTIVCGHTHMPFVRQVDRRTVVNAGSVGMPYGAPGPSWALITPDGVQLRRATMDREAAAERVVRESAYPGRHEWVSAYLLANYSDTEALEAFRARSEG
ncbi:metallophosphoesterase family protein [Kribbella sandramycini]|uniref:Phosphoesterase n=1 Tax=Kribbella sandramycini TaxID=60450 RepID=A0A7Y4L688_9ACTN|nr:YfcE family phosphodiesterase [Kribbella sandramycini]MBB6566134.1 putative phosphoesterase [Kribbella sandramycini]NOL45134.1 metallophosphoesterase family protein [Kribbella sandramycini]